VVRELGLDHLAVAHKVFFPIDWSEWEMVLDPNIVWQFEPVTRSIHLWNSMWSLAGRDKDATYAGGCLYETLKRRYLADWRSPRQDAAHHAAGETKAGDS
jgi:hypothetical protein